MGEKTSKNNHKPSIAYNVLDQNSNHSALEAVY